MPVRKHRSAPPTPPLAEREQPGLVATLTGGPREIPFRCQSCNAPHTWPNPLTRWLEHDAWDRVPAYPFVVVLCKRCGDALIDPHPRLYRALDSGAAFPGAMSVCEHCSARSALSCTSPLAQMNGGAGLHFTWDRPPDWMHLNYGGGRGETKYTYHSPVRSCEGFTARPVVRADACPTCGSALVELPTRSEPEGLRADRHCVQCDARFMCTKAALVPIEVQR